MLIGVASDVHCNTAMLRRAFEAMTAEGVDEILVAGDLMLEYRFSSETVGLLKEYGTRSILGNHDLTLLGPHGERARSAGTVDPDALGALADLPLEVSATCDGRRVLMVHASPWKPTYEYLFPNSPKLDAMHELGADVVVLGHTHVPFVKNVGTCLVVNPGTVGLPRGAGQRCSYGLVDTATHDAEIRFLDTDPA